MLDIQSQHDTREIDIDKVGIRNIEYPIVVKDRDKGHQHTIATLSMSVNLPRNFKGTHMSRFVEVLQKHKSNISTESIGDLLKDMRTELNSCESHVDISFKYFFNKVAPVSKKESLMSCDCLFSATDVNGNVDFITSVTVPVMTVCPCSKEISVHGAHNQRSFVTISVRTRKLVWIEELIEYAEASGSSPIYALIKREDEKFVTEASYDNPAFVEDVVRNATELLDKDDRIIWFEVSSDNQESIHNHNAWAKITRDKR